MITISNQSARRTRVNTRRERLANFCPAETGLRRTAWVNFHEHAPSAFSLVRELKEKVGPASIVNRLAQPPASEPGNIQIFDRDQAILIDDVPTRLVMKVASLVADVIVEARQQKDGFAATVRAFSAPRYTSLQPSQFRLRCSKPARIVDLFAGAERRERSQANINADHVWAKRQWACLAFNTEESKPTASLALNRKRLDGALNRSVKIDPDVADFGQPQPVFRKSVADLSKRHAVIATDGSVSRIARALPTFYTPKERSEREMNAVQRGLKHLNVDLGNIGPELSNLFQLRVLIEPRDRLSLAVPRITAFLKRSIVQLTTQGQLFVKNSPLFSGGVESIAIRVDHAPILPDGFSVHTTKEEGE